LDELPARSLHYSWNSAVMSRTDAEPVMRTRIRLWRVGLWEQHPSPDGGRRGSGASSSIPVR